MKTKDFIKLLQEEDPTGESYLRINGEPIWFLASKPGYWDGPYTYLEKGEDDEYIWVKSTKGDKIDVETMDLFSLAERFDGNWEEMRKHMRFDCGYLDDGEREKYFFEKAKEECDYYNEVMEEIKNYKKEGG